jgi:asparagine synthase (glutamine-hydrolysing)
MPKVCGYLSFQHLTIPLDEINAAIHSLVKLKSEFFFIWSNDKIGLAQFNKAIQNKEFNETLAKDQQIIVGDICLTNRTELLKKFGVLHSDRSESPDNLLVLKAYKKWGTDCVNHFVGDFAFAIWDEKLNRLFCARDHFGNSKLFYYYDNKRFIFASAPAGIIKFSNVSQRLNKKKLGLFLTNQSGFLYPKESWYQNIYPVPAGTTVTVDSQGLKTQKYWQPQLGLTTKYNNSDEVFESFRELLFEIIRSRLRHISKPAFMLSGGLDSSSLVAVAARILEKENKELSAYSAVLENNHNNQFTDESYYIKQFETFPNIKINFVTASGDGPFSNLEKFAFSDTPLLTSRHFLYSALLTKANKDDVNTVFEGFLGELGPTFNGRGFVGEMFRNLNWLTLWRELRLRRNLYGDSIKYNIRANIINPFLPQFLSKIKKNISVNKPIPDDFNPLTPELTSELFENTDFSETEKRTYLPDHRINNLNDIIVTQKNISVVPSNHYFDTPVELRNPFLDKRLLEFCLNLPLEFKVRDGYTRYLIRAGLDKILPTKIQWRTTKKPFSPDYMNRYNAQIGMIRIYLNEIKQNDPIREIFDISKLIKWANLPTGDFASYTANESFALHHLPQAIYTIHFLRRFPEFRL